MDIAAWRVAATAHGATFAEALTKLRLEKVVLDQLLKSHGFTLESRREPWNRAAIRKSTSPHILKTASSRIASLRGKKIDASQAAIVSRTSLTRIFKTSKVGAGLTRLRG